MAALAAAAGHAAEVSARLDGLLPWRTRPVPEPDPCGSCGHIPDTCNDSCC